MYSTSSGASSGEDPQSLRVAVLHESDLARQRAYRLVRQVLAGSTASLPSQVRAWSFNELESFHADHEEAEWARGVDILIAAGSRDQSPPQALEPWIARWIVGDKNRAKALVALGLIFPHSNQPSKIFVEAMEGMAGRLQMRFFQTTAPIDLDKHTS